MPPVIEPLRVLRHPPVIPAMAALFAVHLLLDLREGGRASSLPTTRLPTPTLCGTLRDDLLHEVLRPFDPARHRALPDPFPAWSAADAA